MQKPALIGIARRAYALWEEAGRPDWRDQEFYLEAERELQLHGENWVKLYALSVLNCPRLARYRTAFCAPRAKPGSRRRSAEPGRTRQAASKSALASSRLDAAQFVHSPG